VHTTKFLGGNFSGIVYDNNLFWTVNSRTGDFHQPLEKLDKHGVRVDPLLKMPDELDHMLTDQQNPQFLQSFTLLSASPCMNSGKIITANGTRDFWGNLLPKDTKPDIGAHQASSIESKE
jgi:hypothetical protein